MLPLALVLALGKFSVLVKETEKQHRRALCSIAASLRNLQDCQWVMPRRFYCEVLDMPSSGLTLTFRW